MTTRKLTDQQFKDLKELYVDRIVDNMSMKDLNHLCYRGYAEVGGLTHI